MSGHPTILFAEDSPDDVELIKIGLEHSNFELPVRFVQDGVVAVEYLEGQGQFAERENYPLPAVLLTDLKMPRMDGFALLTWVRNYEEFRSLPVIVMTGSNETPDRLRAMELGANAYLTKGLFVFPPTSLIEAILRFATPRTPTVAAEPQQKSRARKRDVAARQAL